MSSQQEQRFPVIGLMGNHNDGRITDSLRLLARHLHEHGREVILGTKFPGDGLPDAVRRLPEAELAGHCQLLVVIGGDGSLLYAARRVAGTGIPLLGINRGRLGFLTDVSPESMLESLDQVLAGDYLTEARMLLDAVIQPATGSASRGLALNDVVIKRHDATGRMFDCLTYVDDVYVNTHGGDGLVISSPTGSTAYALSCGGPIVEPGLEAIVMAPICPHTFSDRPVVIGASRRIEIRLPASYPDEAEVSCDGAVLGRLKAGDRLQVQASQERVALIHPPGYDYFQILRSKLGWGGGPRDQDKVRHGKR